MTTAEEVEEGTRNPFASPAFRTWWIASVVAGLGVGIQTTIVPLFIRDRVSDDARALAIAGELIAANLAGTVLALFGGVAADRMDRRAILVRTYAVAAVVAGLYLFLSGADVQAIWPVYFLAMVVGAAGAFTNAARQSMVPSMVTRAQLQNGIIFGNMAFLALLQFGGPMIGGFVADGLGLTVAFTVEVCALALTVVLFARVPRNTPIPTGRSVRGDLVDGLRYVRSSSALSGLLVIGVIPGIFIMGPFAVTVVIMVEDVFAASDKFVGMLWAGFGGGIMAGSILMTLRKLPHRGLAACLCIISGGAVFFAYGLTSNVALAIFLLVVLGIVGPAIFINTVVALLQENTEPRMMGRVMSMYSLTFTASAPLGYLQAGLIADAFGPRATILVGASICVGLGVVASMAMRPVTRLP